VFFQGNIGEDENEEQRIAEGNFWSFLQRWNQVDGTLHNLCCFKQKFNEASL
jgi:hypothetical protein